MALRRLWDRDVLHPQRFREQHVAAASPQAGRLRRGQIDSHHPDLSAGDHRESLDPQSGRRWIEQVSTAQFVANMTLMPMVLGYECVDPVMWTLQIEMMFYATLVILFQIGGLQRYFLGWGTLLVLSMFVCPTLDALAGDSRRGRMVRRRQPRYDD